MNVKASDLGWFYHAPPRPQHREPVIPPPPSQIPGLSDISHMPEPAPPRLFLKESDSKYVRLAKMGGRQDLLSFTAPDTASSEPIGYPRCEWYYDNVEPSRPADDCKQEPYQFMLPDYMVFQPNRAKKLNTSQTDIVRGPYSHDSSTVFEREGSMASDKTVKLAEERQPGYGVRTEKKQLALNSRTCSNTHIGNTQPQSNNNLSKQEQQEADMRKILSYSYAGDYDVQKKQYEVQQQQKQQQQEMTAGSPPQRQRCSARQNNSANKCPGSSVKRN